MLLNGGRYGDLYFFDEKTRNEMLPVRLGDRYPNMKDPDTEYGLGSTWHNEHWKQDENGEWVDMFSGWIFGHGSMTSSIFQVDLKNKLIVTMTRPDSGYGYNKYYEEMFKLIDEYMLR